MPENRPDPSGAAHVYGSSTVDKAIDVLVAATTSSAGLTNAELSEKLDLDRSTTHRLISTLERRGLLQRSESRRYIAGGYLRFLAFGLTFDPRFAIEPVLAELVELTSEGASFSVLQGDQFFCVLHQDSPHDLRYSPTSGATYSLNSSATGLALWAFLPKAHREHLLNEIDLTGSTASTIIDRDQLRQELVRTEQRGFATSSGARSPGGCSISSPVFDPRGVLVGAVSLSAAEVRISLERLVEFQSNLLEAAQTIGQSLPWHP